MRDNIFETFLISHGLNGLRQKGCHILVKNWIFNNQFHKNLPVLVILVPVMIRSSEPGIFDRIIKTHVELEHLFCRRPLRLCEVKEISNDGSGINFHYSKSHWASVFGWFVKTFVSIPNPVAKFPVVLNLLRGQQIKLIRVVFIFEFQEFIGSGTKFYIVLKWMCFHSKCDIRV